jgi:hypothetical protein
LYIKKKLVSKLKLATYSDVNGKPSGPKIATNSGAYIYILYYIITLLHFEYGGWWMVGIEKRDLNDINMRRSGMGVRFEQSC